MDTIENINTEWDIPNYKIVYSSKPTHKYCVIIALINEGERILSLLDKMVNHNIKNIADIIIMDGGSTDGSLQENHLKKVGVKTFLVRQDSRRGLSVDLRIAFSFAIEQKYKGVITIDGNDKDNPEAIIRYIAALESGVDYIQGSRFIQGGQAINTPNSRNFAIRFIHSPMLSLFSGFKWTDTTQGFRGYSTAIFLDPKINPFRDIFRSYEMLAYFTYIIPKLGYRCLEIGTTRSYPQGEIPTKISFVRGNLKVLKILFTACFGGYNTK